MGKSVLHFLLTLTLVISSTPSHAATWCNLAYRLARPFLRTAPDALAGRAQLLTELAQSQRAEHAAAKTADYLPPPPPVASAHNGVQLTSKQASVEKQRRNAFAKGSYSDDTRRLTYQLALAHFEAAKGNSLNLLNAIETIDKGPLDSKERHTLIDELKKVTHGETSLEQVHASLKLMAEQIEHFEKAASSDGHESAPWVKAAIAEKTRLLKAFVVAGEVPDPGQAIDRVRAESIPEMLKAENGGVGTQLLALRLLAQNPALLETQKPRLENLKIEGIPATVLIDSMLAIDRKTPLKWERPVDVKFQCIYGEMVSGFLRAEFQDYARQKGLSSSFGVSQGGSMIVARSPLNNSPFQTPELPSVVNRLINEGHDYVFQVNSSGPGTADLYNNTRKKLTSAEGRADLARTLRAKFAAEGEVLALQLERETPKVAHYREGFDILPNQLKDERMKYLFDYILLRELQNGNRLIPQ